jgi:hypothetical protein
MQNVQLVRAAPAQQRITRTPRHTFRLKHRPYQIQPFVIAPVLPGETMTSALIQARAKTDPIAADCDLQGWWLEHYLFYVKLTDLAGRDDFTEMLLTYGHDLSAYETTADVQTYHHTGVNWIELCVDRIVEEYFRDEGDGTVTFDGLHQAQVHGETFIESAKLASATGSTDDLLPGEDGVVPDHLSTDFSTHYTQWEAMRAMKLTAATFEDWVAAFGLKTDSKPAREDYRPELLRYSRDWQYPSTVVSGDGSTTSAVVWSIMERADKKRLFKEPGFIVGVTVARPKVYFSGMRGAGVQMMSDAYAWLPATLSTDPFTSLKNFSIATGGDGPLAAVPSEGYWVDIRDLFLYGDQFCNFDISATPAGFVALPTSAMVKKYAGATNINALFATPASDYYLKQDGVAQFSILGTQRDHT